MTKRASVGEIVSKNQASIRSGWLEDLQARLGDSRIADADLNSEASQMLSLMTTALSTGDDLSGPGWQPLRAMLENLSRSRALQGFSSSETATFVVSLKKPVFAQIRRSLADDAEGLADVTWQANEIIDALGLHT